MSKIFQEWEESEQLHTLYTELGLHDWKYFIRWVESAFLYAKIWKHFLSSLYMDFFLNHPQRYTWTEVFHYNLTLLRSTEKMCTRAGFQLAPSGYRSGALLVELLSSQALEVSFYPTLLHEIFSRQLNAYPWEDVQCFMANGTLWRTFFQNDSVFPFVSIFTFTVSNPYISRH